MADEPISQLQLIGTPPYSANFTTNNPNGGAGGAGGAQIEILDTTNTTMASTGTNSRIFPGDLLKGFLAAGTNVTLTETSGIVTVAAAGGSPGSNNISAVLGQSNNYTVTTSFADIGLSVTLPSAGTYLLIGNIWANYTLLGTNVASDYAQMVAQLYNTTTSAVVPNTSCLILNAYILIPSQQTFYQSNVPFVHILTVAGPTVIDIQAKYTAYAGCTVNNQAIYSYAGQGYTTLQAIQIA